jgi:hypothetical protein
LQILLDRAELFANHRIAVADGGEALLDFGNAMRVNLFNDSETTITTQVAEGVPFIVHFVLARGGLIGEKALDDTRQVQIETPAGATITVVATTFFVTYDANTQITAVGNWDGTVIAANAGMSQRVMDRTYVTIEPGRSPGMAQPLLLDVGGFMERARRLNSPLDVIDELQEEVSATEAPTGTFTVTDVSATVKPASSTTTCPATFAFSGLITANNEGTVRYRWERSDGASTPTMNTTFTRPGSTTVTTQWSLSAPGRHWQRLQVLAPNEISSNQATFTLSCPPEQADLVVSEFEVTGNGAVNAAGNVELPIRVVVSNEGNAAAAIFKVSAHYTTLRGTFVAPFTVPAQSSFWYPFTNAPLAAGAEAAFEGRLTLPAALEGTAVSLKVLADSCSGDEFMPDYCRVEESDEDNNESGPLSVTMPCSLPLVAADATYRAVAGEVDIEWHTVGGCAPFTGTLTGRWSYENVPFVTESLSQPSGSYTNRLVVPCGGGTVIYTVTLFDRDGQRTSDSVNVPVFYIC